MSLSLNDSYLALKGRFHLTAFKNIPEWDTSTSPFGWYEEKSNPNQMCISCKNEFTDKVRDATILGDYKAFYKEVKFEVFHCSCCGYLFSVFNSPS